MSLLYESVGKGILIYLGILSSGEGKRMEGDNVPILPYYIQIQKKHKIILRIFWYIWDIFAQLS